MNIWKIIYLNCGERYEFVIDRRSYTHNLSSCEIKAWKKFRPERYKTILAARGRRKFVSEDVCHENVSSVVILSPDSAHEIIPRDQLCKETWAIATISMQWRGKFRIG